VLSKGVVITRRDAEPGLNSAGGAHVARELDRCPLSSRHGRSAGALPLGEEEPARRRCPRRVLVPLRRSGLIEQGVSDLFARAPRAPVASGSKTGRPPPWSRGSRRHAKKTIDRRSSPSPDSRFEQRVLRRRTRRTPCRVAVPPAPSSPPWRARAGEPDGPRMSPRGWARVRSLRLSRLAMSSASTSRPFAAEELSRAEP